MKKLMAYLGFIALLACLLCPGEAFAQIINTDGAYVRQSGPRYKWCTGPHEFQVKVSATVHHWIYAYFQDTRIHYNVFKPGNYHVRKKIHAVSNEPISITIKGVDPLQHSQVEGWPRIYHWAGLEKELIPLPYDRIQAMTAPALADLKVEDPAGGGVQIIPQWGEPEELGAFADWPPGTNMPQALFDGLGLDMLIGENAPQENDPPNVEVFLSVPEFTAGLQEPELLNAEDKTFLNLAPQQFGQAPINVANLAANPFVMRMWLHDFICVGFHIRSCNYFDPGGYTVTVTANPAYPHPVALEPIPELIPDLIG